MKFVFKTPEISCRNGMSTKRTYESIENVFAHGFCISLYGGKENLGIEESRNRGV